MAVATLTGVLDANKHRLAVATPSDARHLTLVWPHQETANFTGLGIAQQHLVVALASVIFRVGVAAIGLYPETTARIERQPVRRVEHIVSIDIRRARIRVVVNRRVTRDNVQIPVETRRRMVTVVRTHTNDLAVSVAFAWVGAANRRIEIKVLEQDE